MTQILERLFLRSLYHFRKDFLLIPGFQQIKEINNGRVSKFHSLLVLQMSSLFKIKQTLCPPDLCVHATRPVSHYVIQIFDPI